MIRKALRLNDLSEFPKNTKKNAHLAHFFLDKILVEELAQYAAQVENKATRVAD
jgi:hypothetical protein